jgi:probable F420-dependent oxidoreductase
MSQMQFGVVIFPTDYAMPMAELAPACEERGFESLWVAEHTHIPTSRKTPWPGGPELPKHYWHTLDPFIALTAAATATSRLKVGTGICLVIERDPIVLAKEVASLDHVSNGRFLFGIGGGWNREEMEDHGTDYATRWRLLRERILAMKQIWTEEEPSFHGDFVDFEPLWSWPKPVQKPHPPIIVGGNGPTTFDRVIEYGDGWMPIHGRASIVERIAELNRRTAEMGRPRIPVSIFGCPPDGKVIDQYKAAGVLRLLFSLPSAQADVVIPKLDELTELARLPSTSSTAV